MDIAGSMVRPARRLFMPAWHVEILRARLRVMSRDGGHVSSRIVAVSAAQTQAFEEASHFWSLGMLTPDTPTWLMPVLQQLLALQAPKVA